MVLVPTVCDQIKGARCIIVGQRQLFFTEWCNLGEASGRRWSER